MTTTPGAYEQACNNYAVYGDPVRDAYDYEEAARWDSVSEAYADTALDHDYEAWCDEQNWLADHPEERWITGYAAPAPVASDEDEPF